jgi:hypothetical protein
MMGHGRERTGPSRERERERKSRRLAVSSERLTRDTRLSINVPPFRRVLTFMVGGSADIMRRVPPPETTEEERARASSRRRRDEEEEEEEEDDGEVSDRRHVEEAKEASMTEGGRYFSRGMRGMPVLLRGKRVASTSGRSS